MLICGKALKKKERKKKTGRRRRWKERLIDFFLYSFFFLAPHEMPAFAHDTLDPTYIFPSFLQEGLQLGLLSCFFFCIIFNFNEIY